VQVCLDGRCLADLVIGASSMNSHHSKTASLASTLSEKVESTEASAFDGKNEVSNPSNGGIQQRAGHNLRMLRAAGRMLGLNALAQRRMLESQLDKLFGLRGEVLMKLQSRQVKDSLLELRKYRRPPRAAAQARHSSELHLNTKSHSIGKSVPAIIP
jgi:hypothetical protein